MLDEKRLKEIKRKVEKLVKEGVILKTKERKFVQFFLNNSKNSLDSAKLLFETSTKSNLKDYLGFPDFNGFLWVVNSSYYSMFYMARALLESEGIKIRTDLSIHEITFGTLVYYFYLTSKLQKKLVEDFAEAKEEASEMLGREKQKAKELVENYFYEKEKRARFTYELGEIAMENKSKTSLERAKRFNEEIRKILEI